MKKPPTTHRPRARTGAAAQAPMDAAFAEVVGMIQAARGRALQAANTEMIDLYWRLGDYLHHKIEADGWAKGTAVQLAAYIAQREPGRRGFSPQNLWRMRQFFQTYRDDPKLSPLVRVLPWTHNLIILGQSKRSEEREFYLRMAIQQRCGKRELERQFRVGAFERAVLNPPKLSTALREMHPQADSHFKDGYQLAAAGHAAQEYDAFHRERLAEKAAQPDDFDQAVRALPAAKPARKKKQGAP